MLKAISFRSEEEKPERARNVQPIMSVFRFGNTSAGGKFLRPIAPFHEEFTPHGLIRKRPGEARPFEVKVS